MNQSKFIFIEASALYDKASSISVNDQSFFTLLRRGLFVALDSLQKKNFKFVILRGANKLDKSPPGVSSGVDFAKSALESQGIKIHQVIDYNCESDFSDGFSMLSETLVRDYLTAQEIDRKRSAIIGGPQVLALADYLGIQALSFPSSELDCWASLCSLIENRPRVASYERHSTETSISINVNLDEQNLFEIDTGINFLDHLIEQVAKHSGIGMRLKVKGDLHIDDHHTVEDIGIVMGNAIREALGDKLGIERFGFVLPLDEARALVSLDICNRSCCIYKGDFKTEKIGDLSTQMIPHFFQSFSEGLRASLHVEIIGDNSHHMAESAFKALGRTLKQAVRQNGHTLPSTKGLL